MFVSAGNAGCLVDDVNWKSIPEAFAVGGLQVLLYPWDNDLVWSSSNYGEKIDSWAPGQWVYTLSDDDALTCAPAFCIQSGTSFAVPLLVGTAAIACEAAYPDCTTYGVIDIYNAFKATGTSTVFDQDGDPLPSGHPDIVIWQQW